MVRLSRLFHPEKLCNAISTKKAQLLTLNGSCFGEYARVEGNVPIPIEKPTMEATPGIEMSVKPTMTFH